MEAATKDKEIEMASSSSAADSEPNNCSNSEFEKEETMMASSSNNQGKSFNSMGLKHYSAAAEGRFKEFEHLDSKALAKILTPNGNTILHIHITARPRSKISQNIDFLRGVLGKCSDLLWNFNKSKISQNIEFLSGILGKCSDLLWKANKKGETLLHMAARHGHADVAKFLLEECKKPFQNDQESGIKATRLMLQMTNEARDTALHEAVRYSDDHLDVVKVLTEADPELTYDANTAGETPLYLAAERGYADVLDKILTTCTSPADHGPYDRTALHVAVIRKDEEMVGRLLEAGKGIHKSKQDKHGWTPLHFAAHLGYIKILNKLLSKDNSAAYKADNKGKTALHVAAGRGRVDIMREFISKCPDCCELVDERGRNVLHFALESRNKKAVKFILKNPLLRNLINEKDENGNTPLLHAASIGYYNLSDAKVDMQVFNHHNHNAADIIFSGMNTTSWVSEIIPDRFVWFIVNKNVNLGLRMIVSENDNVGERKDEGNTVKSKSKSKEDGGVEDEGNRMSSKSNNGRGKNISIDNLMEKTRQNELVAATLIATVTFAAGFTVPGGFVADKGPDQGAAILIRNTAFRAFVILNNISMFFSCLAVFYHLVESSATHVRDTRELFKQEKFRRLLILRAMMAMIGAFLSGTCAVLHSDRNLAISACVVPVALSAYYGLENNIESLPLFTLRR
ncbi:hypothetical protein LWI29_030502 [Acer saccharum]|uniref:PGG domain-containing protein n=1 Tax=Acer saccharum TaxID=4024 RepID=A0AA39TA45_ACESA|nr:hypothetical protein LWI29_030502 [Acer saccharum]